MSSMGCCHSANFYKGIYNRLKRVHEDDNATLETIVKLPSAATLTEGHLGVNKG